MFSVYITKMQFCSECHNMYYLKIQDEEGEIGNTLIYYCRNCGHEDTTLSTTNICVSDVQLRSSEKKYTHIVNEYTKYDPTLPRINTIKCPNQDCLSNTLKGGAGKKTEQATAMKEQEKAAATAVKEQAATAKATAKAAKEEEKKAKEAAKTAREEAKRTKEAAKAAKDAAKSAKDAVKTVKDDEGSTKLIAEAEEVAAQTLAAAEQAAVAADIAEQLADAEDDEKNVAYQPNEQNREVIYIRYDDTNMKYVYLCVHCDTTWRTDNKL